MFFIPIKEMIDNKWYFSSLIGRFSPGWAKNDR